MAETTRVVAAALIEQDGGILLLRRARDFKGLDVGRGLWEPPGGTVMVGETVEEALRREIYEETHLAPSGAPTLAAVVNYILEPGANAVHRFHVLYSFPVDDANRTVLSEEHDRCRLVTSASELEEIAMIEPLRAWLRARLSEHRPHRAS